MSLKERVKRHVKEFLFLTVLISAASVYPLLLYHQKPLYYEKSTTLATYCHEGKYTYTAELEPNWFYDNKTRLVEGNGTLYTAIMKRLNISFDYNFLCSVIPEYYHSDVKYAICMETEGKWQKVLKKSEVLEYFNYTEDPFTLSFRTENITDIFDNLADETGVGNAKRLIRIIPVVDTETTVMGRLIEEEFQPELLITFDYNENTGMYISLEGLDASNTKSITETEMILNEEVDDMRGISAIFSSTAFSTVILASFLYYQNREPRTGEGARRALIKEYGDLIIRTNVDYVEGLQVFDVDSMEDLSKIAELRMKPIMLFENSEAARFYVIDDQQKFQFIHGLGAAGGEDPGG